jgi:hypothetical protein
LQTSFVPGVCMVLWVTQPIEPWDSIEWVRYSPIASMTPFTTPVDRFTTSDPLGAFQLP